MDAAQRTSRKESCLLALLLFGKADPSLLEDHIDTLIPCLEQALQAQSAFANATSAAAKAKAEAELVLCNLQFLCVFKANRYTPF